MYNKLSKTELVKLAEDKDKALDQLMQDYNKQSEMLDNTIQQYATQRSNIMSAQDLIEVLTNTKVLDGLNETQINAELFRALRLLKHTIGRL